MEAGGQAKDVTEARVLHEGDGGVETDKTVSHGDSGVDQTDTRGAGGVSGRPGAKRARAEEQKQAKEIFTPSQFDSLYYTKFKNMGKAVIINNLIDIGDPPGGLGERVEKLKEILKSLGFEAVNVRDDLKQKVDKTGLEFRNLSHTDTISLMSDASRDDYNNYQDYHCFLAIILTYGEEGVLECDDPHDPRVEVTTLQEFFKDKKTLNMKPKLFFIQAGKRPEEDMNLPDGDSKVEGKIITKKIPREADFFTYFYDMKQLHHGHEFLFLDGLLEALEKYVQQHVKDGTEPLEVNKLAIRMNGILERRLAGPGYSFDDREFKIPCVTSLLTKYMNFNYGAKS